MKNGKANTGSPQFTSKVPGVSGPMSDTGSPNNHLTGGNVPGVSGDSKGNIHGDGSPHALEKGECSSSPNNGANPQHTVTGAMRTPITS
jgi:hypothetical protein